MPKRDEKYMRGQRDGIARAALEVLLEKGVYGTSLRDICKAADISIGALYTHFKTKDDVIVAACAIDTANFRSTPLASGWEEYVDAACRSVMALREPGSWAKKRLRLSLQFTADLSQMEQSPEGLPELFQAYRDVLRLTLSSLHSKHIVSLPFGADGTADMHFQLITGAHYQVAGNPDLDAKYAVAILREGLAITAGYQPAMTAPLKTPVLT